MGNVMSPELNPQRAEIALGARVKDIVTGFEGVAVIYCKHLSGLIEWGVRPKAKDGIRPDVYYIEECSLVLLEDKL